MALFDSNQRNLITAVQTLFGDTLLWLPSSGVQQSAKVLYNSPEAKQTLGDADKYEYNPYNYWFDYFIDQLTGLKDSVDSGNLELVTVKGLTLVVRQVVLKFDGKTYIAFCEDYLADKTPEEINLEPIPEP
jgi:hypothetical protein